MPTSMPGSFLSAETSFDSEAFQIVECDRNHAKATAFNVLFMVWRFETTFEAFQRAGHVALYPA